MIVPSQITSLDAAEPLLFEVGSQRRRARELDRWAA